MNFEKIEGGKLIFSETLSECDCCHRPMLPWYKELPREVYAAASLNRLVKESYRDTGVCISCVSDGGFHRECCVCGNEKVEFPKGFALEVTSFPKYPEDETNFRYICKGCKANRAAEVLDYVIRADDFQVVK